MPTTTNHSIYYPDSATSISPLESVFSTLASSVETAMNTIDTNIETVQDDVDTKATAGELGVPFRMAAGSGSDGAALGNGSSETFNITFPVGRFSYAPIVSVSSTSVRYTLAVSSITSSGFTLTVRNNSGATGTTYSYYWTATQMLIGSAAG